MIRVTTGDLIAIEREKKFYYAFVADKLRLFGGNLLFVFHKSSRTLLSAEELRTELHQGFYAFVDLIYAKRENRVHRLGKRVNLATKLPGIRGFKRTMTISGKARIWLLSDLDLRDVAKVAELTDEQKKLPLLVTYTDFHLAELAERKWSPEKDERI